MSHPENDELNDILRDQIEAIAKLNPDQLKVFNAVQEVLFKDYFTTKLQQQDEDI